MRYYWMGWVAILLSIGMYFLGSQDQMNDVVKDCNTKNEFVADGVSFICINKEEYFK